MLTLDSGISENIYIAKYCERRGFPPITPLLAIALTREILQTELADENSARRVPVTVFNT